ncbi:MAG: dual specificity protein phosphatase family protein [Planctomycetes bacterium]|nr:dual specificity protein phosphatase family protein [Planctomycetota bacterium]
MQMLLLAFGCGVLVWMYEPWWARMPLAWGALTFLLVAAAYALNRPALFGKRADGRLQVLSSLPLFPYLLLQSATHHLQRLLSSEDAFNEIHDGLFLGRRLTAREQREVKVLAVLDLTAEWTERRPFRDLDYLCIPVLDKAAPTQAELETGVAFICEKLKSGSVYVHCAQGHGRSGIFVAAAAIALGVSDAPRAAVEFMQHKRPGAKPSRAQLASLEEYALRLRSVPS